MCEGEEGVCLWEGGRVKGREGKREGGRNRREEEVCLWEGRRGGGMEEEVCVLECVRACVKGGGSGCVDVSEGGEGGRIDGGVGRYRSGVSVLRKEREGIALEREWSGERRHTHYH